jgi:hypothetical protein
MEPRGPYLINRAAAGHLTGIWIINDVPRELMHGVKVAAAIQKIRVKQLLFDLTEAHRPDLERKGSLTTGK